MRPSAKHQNQQPVMLSDFSGGLNTSASDEMIALNQMSYLVNMEINSAGKLRTVRGTNEVINVSQFITADIKSAAWDDINKALVVFCKDGNSYALMDDLRFVHIGELNGDEEVVTVNWEDGLLVASGGYLQYVKYVGASDPEEDQTALVYKMNTISTSPPDSRGVYVRSGRVFVFDGEDNLVYSAVGDEESWDQESNDDSSSIFTQIGYKSGGRIIGLINLQSYVLIIKDNGKIFRLENEYPDWAIKEVTSQGICKGAAAFASIGSNVVILGERTLQQISPTDDYGNMPVTYIGKQVENEIASLPAKTKIRFNPELNQLWFVTGSQWVLVLDCNTSTFFQRYFNSDVVDIVGNTIIKRDRICELSVTDEVATDNNAPLEYRARFKTDSSYHDILVKKVDLGIVPLVDFYENAVAAVKVGKIVVPFPDRVKTYYRDDKRQRVVGVTNEALEPLYTHVDGDKEGSDDVFLNEERTYHGMSLHYKKRQVYRDHMMEISLSGSGFPFVLNYISYDRVEV